MMSGRRTEGVDTEVDSSREFAVIVEDTMV